MRQSRLDTTSAPEKTIHTKKNLGGKRSQVYASRFQSQPLPLQAPCVSSGYGLPEWPQISCPILHHHLLRFGQILHQNGRFVFYASENHHAIVRVNLNRADVGLASVHENVKLPVIATAIGNV
jgi:hypothetical protein